MAKNKIETCGDDPVPDIRINQEAAGTIGVDGSHTQTPLGQPEHTGGVSPMARIWSNRGARDERHKAQKTECDHVIGFIQQTGVQARINFDVLRLIRQNEVPEPPAKIGGSACEGYWHRSNCAWHTYQAIQDSGSVITGDLVTHFPDADEYWITRSNGSEKVRKITAEEFNVVRMEWLQKATRQE